jgi:ribosomal protein L24
MKIRKDDEVMVIAGDDRGKTGKVKEAIPDANKVIVEGVNLVRKHLRPHGEEPQGGAALQGDADQRLQRHAHQQGGRRPGPRGLPLQR